MSSISVKKIRELRRKIGKKLANALLSDIKDIDSSEIEDAAITAAKLAAEAVSEEKIDDGAITSEKLATAVAEDIAEGVEAHGWGDHSAAGYEDAADMATDVPANESDPVVGAITGIVKADGAGNISAASAGTDYQAPLVAGTDYQTPLVAGTDYQEPLVAGIDYLAPDGDGSGLSGVVKTEEDPIVGAVTGIVKADGAGNISAASAGTDYQAPLVAGTDYLEPDGDGSSLTGVFRPNVESADLSGSAPSQANMVTAFGAAADHDGESYVLSDSSDASKSYHCFSDGVAWFYLAGTVGSA